MDFRKWLADAAFAGDPRHLHLWVAMDELYQFNARIPRSSGNSCSIHCNYPFNALFNVVRQKKLSKLESFAENRSSLCECKVPDQSPVREAQRLARKFKRYKVYVS